MKKFKKILALAVATVTLVTTAITTCAATFDKEQTIRLGAIKDTYYLADNTIHYSDLLRGYYNRNTIIFSSVYNRLKEGNVVLSVDFSDPNSDCEWDISDETFESIPDYLCGLHLKDANGKFITEGKYPLIVDYNAPDAYINIKVATNEVFKNFDITPVCYYFVDYNYNDIDNSPASIQLHYQITNAQYYVLPSYKIVLEEITNSPNPKRIVGEPGKTAFLSELYKPKATQGYFDFESIPCNEYRGKSFNVIINGMKVGKITIDSKYDKISYVNY